jgi:hypothetical protein
VSEETISVATDIPMQGEKWFKGMSLDTSCYIDFMSFKLTFIPMYNPGKDGRNCSRQS